MKEAKQARSRETQRKLIHAAEEVIREQGAEGLKVDILTSRAGCSVGSFYNLFQDRNEIISAVMREFKSRMIEEINNILSLDKHERSSREQVFEIVVDFAVHVYSGNDSLFRVAQGAYSDIPELVDNGNEIVAVAVDRLAALPCMQALDRRAIEFLVRINIASCDHYLFWQKLQYEDPLFLKKMLLNLLRNAYPN
ncbi:TetR/AcrR family transcriptional regulator [Pseudobacteriovorax antillogorgiicola]|uniref:Transcriptional regulator, TetR family n=1 Tax=Pseudobacteriovorax antillogorgiicola TaxID=1513793 RepID=A0A1Y6CNG2_9BACT|nr:TetR/AcrR family transcriptional regulator [Pseudobacteriovorax antillogorgiicola]TCS45004.1 TetR family transcriptional regulator [Pseudobacteriovorax antillogorgiicola]SMF76467.1 transcriptional regulator, TetR family [Pseudobacteriovorax antillogorgiicola]